VPDAALPNAALPMRHCPGGRRSDGGAAVGQCGTARDRRGGAALAQDRRWSR